MAQALVTDLIASKPVVVFSKSYCPYCVKAKAALTQELGAKAATAMAVVELDERDDGPAIQAYLGELTGGTSVPRVFVGGKFIGGGDDTVAKQRSGELRKMLAALGL